jgi:threonine dehydratase
MATADTFTPFEPAPASLGLGNVWLKREDAHELGVFKWRGALPVVRAYRDGGVTTVVTASTGNHGAATAWAACELGLRAVVFVPELATEAKLSRIVALGAELQRVGRDFDEAKDAAIAYAATHELPLFVDGLEPAQYEGYRAIGHEIADQLAGRAGTVVVPVGNGALIGGIGEAMAGSGWRVIGVVAKDAPVMADSHDAGRVQVSASGTTIADGLAVRVAIPYAVRRIQPVVERMVRVSERELAYAIRELSRAGLRVEASAAASLAALRHLDRGTEPIVLVITGRNIDDALYERACSAPETFEE